MASRWVFKDYVTDGGENVIRSWLSGLPPGARARINAAIRNLEPLPELRRPYSGDLKGNCSGLIELRIPYQKVQYRPLGCYGPGRKEVTLLFGAIEKDNRLEPPSACSTALTRKARIAERGRTCDHDFD